MPVHRFNHIQLSGSNSFITSYDINFKNQYSNLNLSNSDFKSIYSQLYDNFPHSPVFLTCTRESSSDFLINLENRSLSTDVDIYPSNLRYETSSFLFYERKPFKASVLYKDGPAHSRSRQSRYSFWVPWTLYAISKDSASDVYIYYSDKELTDKDDFYLLNVFPNSYSDSKVCIGMSSDLVSTSFDMNRKIRFESFINDYWSGSWNNDLSNIFIYFNNLNYSSYNFDSSKYPLISSYINFTDEILYRFKSHYNLSRFKYLLSKKNVSQDYNSRRNSSIRILSFLEVLTLEETLMFFSELKEFTKNNTNITSYVSSFSSLISKFLPYETKSVFNTPRNSINSLIGASNTDISHSLPSHDNRYLISFIFDDNHFSNDANPSIGLTNRYSRLNPSSLNSFTTSQFYSENFSDLYYLHNNITSNYLNTKSSSNIYPILSDSDNLGKLLFIKSSPDSASVLCSISFGNLFLIIQDIVNSEDYTEIFSLNKESGCNDVGHYYTNFMSSYKLLIQDYKEFDENSFYNSSFKYLFSSFCSIIHLDLEYYFNKYFIGNSELSYSELFDIDKLSLQG